MLSTQARSTSLTLSSAVVCKPRLGTGWSLFPITWIGTQKDSTGTIAATEPSECGERIFRGSSHQARLGCSGTQMGSPHSGRCRAERGRPFQRPPPIKPYAQLQNIEQKTPGARRSRHDQKNREGAGTRTCQVGHDRGKESIFSQSSFD